MQNGYDLIFDVYRVDTFDTQKQILCSVPNDVSKTESLEI